MRWPFYDILKKTKTRSLRVKIIEEFKKNISIVILIVFTLLFIRLLDNFHIIMGPLVKILNISRPFLYSFIIAYVLSPVVKLFEKLYGGRRVPSVLSTYAFIILFIALLSNYIFPKIGENFYELYIKMPLIVANSRTFLLDLAQNEKLINILTLGGLTDLNVDSIFSRSGDYIQSFSSYMISQTASVAIGLFRWIFAFLVSIYVLVYKERFKAFGIKMSLKLFGRKVSREAFNLFKTIHKMLGLYIGTKAIDSLIIGGIALVGLYLMDSPFVFLLSFLVFVTNMVPYFGPFVGMTLTASIHLFYSPSLALASLIFLFLLQQFDAWFLDPKLIGNKVGINPFLVILAVTLGGRLFGPVGMILAAPIMSTLKIYMDRFLKKTRI